MSWLNKTLIIISMLHLSACGFSPVYGERSQAQKNSLAAITIKAPKSREGAWLQMALEDRFNPSLTGHSSQYTLEPTVQINSLPVIIESNGKIQRYRLKMTSSYVLKDNATLGIIKTGTMSRLVSYSVSESDYSTFVAPNDAIKRGIDELAADYEAYFISYFSYKK